MESARAVLAATVAALNGCGDKYGDKLHEWLSNMVDGQRPQPVPRLDERRLSAKVCRRRKCARDAATAFRALVHARWSGSNTARKGKRKVERQAERRSIRRNVGSQLEEPMDADRYYDDGPDVSDDEDAVWPPVSQELSDGDDGPVACSEYEIDRLRTIVANCRVLVNLFASDEEEAAKSSNALSKAVQKLEAQEAINQSVAWRKLEHARKAQRQSQLEAAARRDAWEDACM